MGYDDDLTIEAMHDQLSIAYGAAFTDEVKEYGCPYMVEATIDACDDVLSRFEAIGAWTIGDIMPILENLEENNMKYNLTTKQMHDYLKMICDEFDALPLNPRVILPALHICMDIVYAFEELGAENDRDIMTLLNGLKEKDIVDIMTILGKLGGKSE